MNLKPKQVKLNRTQTGAFALEMAVGIATLNMRRTTDIKDSLATTVNLSSFAQMSAFQKEFGATNSVFWAGVKKRVEDKKKFQRAIRQFITAQVEE